MKRCSAAVQLVSSDLVDFLCLKSGGSNQVAVQNHVDA